MYPDCRSGRCLPRCLRRPELKSLSLKRARKILACAMDLSVSRLTVLRRQLLLEMQEVWLHRGSAANRARIRRLQYDVLDLADGLEAEGLWPRIPLRMDCTPVLWWSASGRRHGCSIELLDFERTSHRPDFRSRPQVCLSLYKPGGRWRLDRAYLWIEMRRISISSFIIYALPHVINSEFIDARTDREDDD